MTLDIDGLERVYEGKTKDVYKYGGGKIVLRAKDTVTGWVITGADGVERVVEDPGANAVVGRVEGLGLKNVKSSAYYFEMLENAGVPTHYIAGDVKNAALLVREAEQLGFGLECIVRYYAMGSIVRAYPKYLYAGQQLNGFFEITTKDDEAGDPRISKELLDSPDFGAPLPGERYEECRSLCSKAAAIIRADLAESDLTLVDIKFEIGLAGGRIVIIDEVSAGMMRAVKRCAAGGGGRLPDEALAGVLSEETLAGIISEKAGLTVDYP